MVLRALGAGRYCAPQLGFAAASVYGTIASANMWKAAVTADSRPCYASSNCPLSETPQKRMKSVPCREVMLFK